MSTLQEQAEALRAFLAGGLSQALSEGAGAYLHPPTDVVPIYTDDGGIEGCRLTTRSGTVIAVRLTIEAVGK